MSLNLTPSANRIHIGLFGRTNTGKSSLMNALTNQDISIVSSVNGTTTDPVRKTMELFPLGPVVFIDTPGLDDKTELGEIRENKSLLTLRSVDIAIIVLDITVPSLSKREIQLFKEIQKRNIPYLIVVNKVDAYTPSVTVDDQDLTNLDLFLESTHLTDEENLIFASTVKKIGIRTIITKIEEFAKNIQKPEPYIADCLSPSDKAILVIPIDEGAPKGRIILPQQQVLRELLENGIITTVVRETELEQALNITTPKVVITDSQAFAYVSSIVPNHIYLTSFSILMARAKLNLNTAIKGAYAIDMLNNDDRVLISEGCTHHRQCSDIGTVKLPSMLSAYTGKRLHFEWTSGKTFKKNLDKYRLVIHCGGCMLNDQEMHYRYQTAAEFQTPITNYGLAIAHMQRILTRSTKIFEDHALRSKNSKK